MLGKNRAEDGMRPSPILVVLPMLVSALIIGAAIAGYSGAPWIIVLVLALISFMIVWLTILVERPSEIYRPGYVIATVAMLYGMFCVLFAAAFGFGRAVAAVAAFLA